MPALTSFVTYDASHPFSLENLPYGIFSNASNPNRRAGVAIGDLILDLCALSKSTWFKDTGIDDPTILQQPTLNALIALEPGVWAKFRAFLQSLLSSSSPLSKASAEEKEQLFAARLAPSVQLHLPIEIGDYTDFYSSIEHATNCGVLFRGKENALQKNWRWLPVGYHGRASSIVVSGTPFHRPCGQILPPQAEEPVFAPCKKLDYELEMGFVYGGSATKPGQRLSSSEARKHLFGCFLLNDWSARDIQAWEYVPLGPFLSKNFCTTVSPWIVPLLALEPFKAPQYDHQPALLSYLEDVDGYNFDVPLKVEIRPAQASGEVYTTVAKSSVKHTYFTPAQMLAHHTTTGCTMRPGDVLGTGTLSAPGTEGYGSLLEKSEGGKRSFRLFTATPAVKVGSQGEVLVDGKDASSWIDANSVERTFLEDGDSVRMTAKVEGDGFCIGFGECEAKILPALP
ncbi:uncharacterized protein PFL1_00250 [Pseudozyma flocculosa PF-1]|uniref:Fumarylacetoacetase n=1 Tax=Pseudozyma flocculosa TaxID=84751 RepID=A0A5C3ET47_9BASI|nr:uncharacterized protein PFL1_00250 [Pseudozyma flocculosa PF-1]EPQ32052.1 hypothetical protein PFL1_00250 [Pseudozyma flocculosa PF-1]SPO35020.1 related to fumarylacetoacetate hydrolase [Pseudozyma flocculosa]